jgi:hypothetical protein
MSRHYSIMHRTPNLPLERLKCPLAVNQDSMIESEIALMEYKLQSSADLVALLSDR